MCSEARERRNAGKKDKEQDGERAREPRPFPKKTVRSTLSVGELDRTCEFQAKEVNVGPDEANGRWDLVATDMDFAREEGAKDLGDWPERIGKGV